MIDIQYYTNKIERKSIIDSLINSRVLHDDFIDQNNKPTNGSSGKLTIVSGIDDPNNTIIPTIKIQVSKDEFISELAAREGKELI